MTQKQKHKNRPPQNQKQENYKNYLYAFIALFVASAISIWVAVASILIGCAMIYFGLPSKTKRSNSGLIFLGFVVLMMGAGVILLLKGF